MRNDCVWGKEQRDFGRGDVRPTVPCSIAGESRIIGHSSCLRILLSCFRARTSADWLRCFMNPGGPKSQKKGRGLNLCQQFRQFRLCLLQPLLCKSFKKAVRSEEFSVIWNNMVNFIHYFGYLEPGYMEFPLIWDILAGTNAFLVSGIVCICVETLFWGADNELWDLYCRFNSCRPYSCRTYSLASKKVL